MSPADPVSHNEARRITNRLYELPVATDAGTIQKPDGYWMRTAEELRRYLLDNPNPPGTTPENVEEPK